MRCPWAEQSDEEREWHDTEWGRALHGEQALFELLALRGAQAGLAWRTVLRKREAYRELFHEFDIGRVAAMDDDELMQVAGDRRIIRHRLKIASVRTNARIVVAMAERGESLDGLLWSFTGGAVLRNARQRPEDVPMRSPESDAMSHELRRRGFQYAGTAICYSIMQSAGMVDDHLVGCPCHGATLR
jgi:DNA-3-methyladenine glycosylase I